VLIKCPLFRANGYFPKRLSGLLSDGWHELHADDDDLLSLLPDRNIYEGFAWFSLTNHERLIKYNCAILGKYIVYISECTIYVKLGLNMLPTTLFFAI
jgi:hypothetical protein